MELLVYNATGKATLHDYADESAAADVVLFQLEVYGRRNRIEVYGLETEPGRLLGDDEPLTAYADEELFVVATGTY